MGDGACVAKCPESYIKFTSAKPHRCLKGPVYKCTDGEGCVCDAAKVGKGCTNCDISADGVTCSKCEDARYFVEGKCRVEITCKGSKFEELPQKGCNCKGATPPSPGNDCFRCKFRNGFDSPVKTCVRCRNAKFFQDGVCVGATGCNDGRVAAGAGKYGRECRMPFTCKRNRAVDGPNAGSPCKCSSPSCVACKWSSDGDECQLCRGKMYLNKGVCGDSCPNGVSKAGVGSFGRFCAPAFDCQQRKHAGDGRKCKCPNGRFCDSCSYANDNEAGVARCTACRNDGVLNKAKGTCAKP